VTKFPRVALFFVLAFASAAAVPAAEVVERIIAVVNDEIVTEQDLQVSMGPVIAQYRTVYAGKEFDQKLQEARKEFLGKVIEDKLILSEAKRLLVIVKDEEVDEMLNEVRNKFPNRETFLRAIEEQGLTEKKLWNRFRDQLMTQKLVAYEVKSKVSVSPGEVSEYYKANQALFVQGDRARLEHILIRTATRGEEESKLLADKIATELAEGKPFDELARTYSEGAEAKEGGQMGWMEKGQLMGEIDEKVFALAEGGVTPPIKSSLGYHIFRVAERQKTSVKPLSDVRQEINDKLFRKKLDERLGAWIADLKKGAYVSIR